MLTRPTCDTRYEIGITPRKKKLNKSQSTQPNKSMSNEKNEKKNQLISQCQMIKIKKYFKKDLKKD